MPDYQSQSEFHEAADELLVLSYLIGETTAAQEEMLQDRLSGDEGFRLLFADLSATVLPIMAHREAARQEAAREVHSTAVVASGSTRHSQDRPRRLSSTHARMIACLSVCLIVLVPALILSKSALWNPPQGVALNGDDASIVEDASAMEALLTSNWAGLQSPIEESLDPQLLAYEDQDEEWDPMQTDDSVPGWMMLAVRYSLDAEDDEIPDTSAEETL